jgi:hypothetical protein
MKLLNSILTNYKTTLSGIAAISVALSDGFEISDISAIVLGLGLIFGKDVNRSNAAHPIARSQVVD